MAEVLKIVIHLGHVIQKGLAVNNRTARILKIFQVWLTQEETQYFSTLDQAHLHLAKESQSRCDESLITSREVKVLQFPLTWLLGEGMKPL